VGIRRIVSVVDMWLQRYTTGPSCFCRTSNPSMITLIPSFSAVVTEEKHALAHFSVVRRPNGSLSAQ
jgi:hypothetical protein